MNYCTKRSIGCEYANEWHNCTITACRYQLSDLLQKQFCTVSICDRCNGDNQCCIDLGICSKKGVEMKYDRLTKVKDDRIWEDEEFWTSSEEPDDKEIDAIYTRLAELEDKIDDRMLVELPCKVGDKLYKVYYNVPFGEDEVVEYAKAKVMKIGICQHHTEQVDYILGHKLKNFLLLMNTVILCREFIHLV